jgi:hypothetical protein
VIDPAAETASWHAGPAWTTVTVTDKRARVPLVTFGELADYSCTLPSGVYIGKRWKRHVPFRGSGQWWMGEYAEDPDPEQARILWRLIDIVVNEGTPDEYVIEATDKNIDALKTAVLLTAAR